MSGAQFDFDVAVIGGGSGGYAAARTAAAGGLKTAVIEGGADVGGLCILRGCMPTKALLYAAEVRHLAQYGALWGMKPGEVAFDWSAVMARKDGLIREFADFRRGQLADGRFEFIRARAEFQDAHTVLLHAVQEIPAPAAEPSIHPAKLRESRMKQKASAALPRPAPSPLLPERPRLTARYFVLSTGSVVSPPPLPQLQAAGYITSDEALALPRPPKSLIVLGGGAVAAEFAQFFARFDVKVTLIQRGPRLLKEFDDDAGLVVEKVFRREGITVFTGTQLADAWVEGRNKVVSFVHGGAKTTVAAEEVLLALGRAPATAGLGLERAGVVTERGRILANDRMQTSASHIYAAGDCTGPHEIVHIAIQQGETAAHNILHRDRPRSMDYRLLTSVVFTDPQVATVGLTEKAARAQGAPYLAASYPFADHGKSLIMESRDGFVKLLVAPATGEILGGSCAGPMGGELIHEIIAAMAGRMSAQELAAMPHYHPTLAEIWTYPAEELAERTGRPT